MGKVSFEIGVNPLAGQNTFGVNHFLPKKMMCNKKVKETKKGWCFEKILVHLKEVGPNGILWLSST